MSATGRMSGRGRWLVALVPALWLAVFFLLPFGIVLKISLSEPALASPPYLPLLRWPADGGLWPDATGARLDSYLTLLSDGLYLRAWVGSLRIAAIGTVLCLMIGLPLAYAIARAPGRWRPALMVAVILPFWTAFLIRVYAWIAILKDEGLLNGLLLATGVIDRPLVILDTEIAVWIGIAYAYLPFMVLPIHARLERMDPTLLEAAADLGCPPARAFWRVTLPLAGPGILAGCLLVFIPAVGEFVIPDLLGGPGLPMIGKTLWTEFFHNRDWPLASAVAVALLALLLPPILWFERLQTGGRTGDRP